MENQTTSKANKIRLIEKANKIRLIEKAIDAIFDVATDVQESDVGFLVDYENSVVSQLRDLKDKIRQSEEA